MHNRNVEQDEFIVLACDGIWDVQTNAQCISLISEIFAEGESNVGLVCEEVLDTCLNEGSKDNMTVMILKLPAQKIGKGGGVKARREERRKALQLLEENDRKAKEDELHAAIQM